MPVPLRLCVLGFSAVLLQTGLLLWLAGWLGQWGESSVASLLPNLDEAGRKFHPSHGPTRAVRSDLGGLQEEQPEH
jgi:hypothetical protein